ncbi:MAG: hypothetical protein GX221_09325 [Candidatus Riflebacteria bacterium]|nr:hypothetical protein [Candidatus Riflebacteria bacterium]
MSKYYSWDIKLRQTDKKPEEIFYQIENILIKIVINSSNYKKIPPEELNSCIDIVAVDAFIRCKIFENPESHNKNVTAR